MNIKSSKTEMTKPCCPGFETVSKCCPGLKFNEVTHVIFDLDGTLLDTQEIYDNAMKEIMDKYEKTFTDELCAEIAGCRQQDLVEKVLRAVELPLTPEEFLQLYRDITNAKISDAPLMPGAENIIRHFQSHDVPIAIATSSSQDSFNLKTKNYQEIFNLFDHVVCGGTDPEVTQGKPYPDIFLICASRFPDSPDPSKCLVFEDAPNGVQAALNAGMQVVMIPNERVPYDIWKTATLRLDNFDCMVPGAFGLPPFPCEEADFPPIQPMRYSMQESLTEAEIIFDFITESQSQTRPEGY